MRDPVALLADIVLAMARDEIQVEALQALVTVGWEPVRKELIKRVERQQLSVEDAVRACPVLIYVYLVSRHGKREAPAAQPTAGVAPRRLMLRRLNEVLR